jgi:hypothetical protein
LVVGLKKKYFSYSNKINDFNGKLTDLQDRLDKKENDVELIQNELDQLKEFRKKKIQMQKDLEDVNSYLTFWNDPKVVLKEKADSHYFLALLKNEFVKFKIKESMILNEKEHKEQMYRVEEKFFEEKMRLQKEANMKIDELAERAHDAAIKWATI